VHTTLFFATEADQYTHVRPTYPESLFTYLSTTVALRFTRFRGSIRVERLGCTKAVEDEQDRQVLLA
jgi:hypothetical protein